MLPPPIMGQAPLLLRPQGIGSIPMAPPVQQPSMRLTAPPPPPNANRREYRCWCFVTSAHSTVSHTVALHVSGLLDLVGLRRCFVIVIGG